MYRKMILCSAFPTLVGLGLLAATAVSAHGFFWGMGGMGIMGGVNSDQYATNLQTMFQNEASALGISVDDVKNGWAEGKSIAQIAQEHGITEDQLQQKMKDARLNALKSNLQTLVSKGVITQAQTDQRLQFMQNKSQNMGKRGGRGMHGMGFWF